MESVMGINELTHLKCFRQWEAHAKHPKMLINLLMIMLLLKRKPKLVS